MKTTSFFLLAYFGFSLAAFGFRSFNDGSDSLVQAHESSFQVAHQIVLYDVAILTADGRRIDTQAFLIYQYGDDSARGIWRILPSEQVPAVTLLVLQGPEFKTPNLFLRDESSGLLGWLEGREKQARLGPTGWNLEDAYDDDKEDWNNTRGPNRQIGNTFCTQLIQSYRDPVLRRESLYGSRAVFLSTQDKRLLQLNYFDTDKKLIKRLIADNHADLGGEDGPRIRARRLTIRHFQVGSITIMNLRRANYDCTLPTDFFSPHFVATWSDDQDQQLLQQTFPIDQLLKP